LTAASSAIGADVRGVVLIVDAPPDPGEPSL
jgi:hypothetical protein